MANPIRNYRFEVDFDGIGEAQFTDVAGFNATTDVIEYRTGKDREIRKFPGITKYGNVTLKRAVTSDDITMYDMLRRFIDNGDGNPDDLQKLSGSIKAQDFSTGDTRAVWNFSGAFPMKYTAPDFTAKGNDVAIESLELVVERIERVAV